jgi:hypothetical protein
MNANLSASASTAGTFVRAHRVRLAAGAFVLAALLPTVLLHSGIALLVLAPALIGAAVPLAGSPPLSDAVERWRETFLRTHARGMAGSGKFARYFLRPLAGGSLGLWRATERISDPQVRAGVRLAAVLYFWAAMISLLLAAVYAIVGLIIICIGFMIVGHLLGWDDNQSSGRYNNETGGWRQRLGGKQLVSDGLFGQTRTGTKVDADGRVISEGLFGDTPSGIKFNDDGRIVREGLFGDTPTGQRLNEHGQLVDEGLFGETPTGKKLDRDNRIVEEGFLGDRPTGFRLAD